MEKMQVRSAAALVSVISRVQPLIDLRPAPIRQAPSNEFRAWSE